MVKTVLFTLLGVSAGLALASLFEGNSMGSQPLDALDSAAPGGLQRAFGPGPGELWEERLGSLEAALEEEVTYRMALEAELAALGEELEEFRAQAPQQRRGAVGETGEVDPEEIRARFAERFGNSRGGNSTERRATQLTEAGFSAGEAQQIVQRESELRMEALYAQYEATREGEPFNPFTDRFADQNQLRQELGDGAYERYLDATGQSTSIGVRQVLASSPGETAGLQPGDEIVAYGGERVFAVNDLNRLTLEGDPGTAVAVDVLRDGQPMQIVVPRGPIGITSGRGSPGGGRGPGR